MSVMYSSRVLIQQHGEACSLAHFARLFQRQLVEVKKSPLSLSLSLVLLCIKIIACTHSQSCRYPLHYRLSPSSQGEGGEGGVGSELAEGSGLMGQLGKTDPQRLMR